MESFIVSEYKDVERPLLTHLATMGWEVHDLGPGIPKDPATSFRSSFREVVLSDRFKQAVQRIKLISPQWKQVQQAKIRLRKKALPFNPHLFHFMGISVD
ncbi:hypothetical protein [Endozoicomonas acroporae]|uniref:hypothetical protein n=1 Tax=Endozoicomonas acroporae TaxID=1701104 RepID=UPI003D7AA47C